MKFNIVKCSDIIDVRDGTHDSPKYVESGYPLVTSKNIKDNKIGSKAISKIKKVIDKNAEYQVGEIIKHTDFGEGVVISIDKTILTVAFPHPIGIKKLMKGHPSITKLS